MDDQAHGVIDVQFDRAVEIVQGLPKAGPVQTGYEEKLAMYRSVDISRISRKVWLNCALVFTSKVGIPKHVFVDTGLT